MNYRILSAVPLLGLLAGAASAAGGPGTSYVEAPVESVRPVVRLVTVERPRRECREEVVYEPAGRREPIREAAPSIVGGLLGGLIGNQLTRSHNRDELTLIGAVAGSAIASNRAARSRRYEEREVRAVTVERCSVVNEQVTEERIEGYDVTYRYDGVRYQIRTPEHPGSRVRLRVSVTPVGF